MKKDAYQDDTVLVTEELLACCRDGKSGDKKTAVPEKTSSVRVPALPRAFLLSILLAEDLTEHILLTLSSKVISVDTETGTWSKSQHVSTKKSILGSMVASGDSLLNDKTQSDGSLFRLLESYLTGAHRTKMQS